jgi:signal transduction histidine kinase
MKPIKARPAVDVTTSELHTNARRVALKATLFALIGGVLICAIADVVAVQRESAPIKSELSERVGVLLRATEPSLSAFVAKELQVTSPSKIADFDSSSYFEWFIPTGSSTPLRLNDATPVLPSAEYHTRGLRTASIEGRSYELDGSVTASGLLIVGQASPDGGVLSTLLLVQGVLAPLALVMLYFVAVTIGRRAAAPVDRARLRQLEFAADASHELRTPLSVIEAEVSLSLSAERSVGQYRETLGRVGDESLRLRKIVDDLLWLARLDAVPDRPAHEPVDVAIIAESCAARFVAVAAQRQVHITSESAGSGEPLIMAPVEWIDQLFSVVIDNATRYVNEGGTINVRVDAVDGRITATIDDSGPGFGDNDRDELLQRFRRATAVRGGAGLGLAIAGAVVAATHGMIILGSSPSGGARVSVSWPRLRAPSRESHASSNA